MTTAPGPPVILPAIFTGMISPTVTELGRSTFSIRTSGGAVKALMKNMKSGMNEAQINTLFARRKPGKNIVVNPVKSRLVSFEIQVNKLTSDGSPWVHLLCQGFSSLFFVRLLVSLRLLP